MLILSRDFKGLPEMSALAVRYNLRKLCSSLVKMKGHAVFHALDMGVDDPAVVTGPCLRAGFAAAGNGLQDAASIGISGVTVLIQILLYINGPQYRLMCNGLVPDRELQEDGKAPVCPVLIFAGTADVDLVPPFAPVCGKGLQNAFRALCDHKEGAVRPAAYHVPSLFSPCVCFFDEEVRCKTGIDRGSGWDPEASFEGTGAEFSDWQIETAGLVYIRRILTVLFITPEHIAMLTAGAHFFAAVPQVPSDSDWRAGIFVAGKRAV